MSLELAACGVNPGAAIQETQIPTSTNHPATASPTLTPTLPQPTATMTRAPIPTTTPTPTSSPNVGWSPDQPITIPQSEVATASEDEIMIRLFEAYLKHCEDKDADPFYRILAYADVSIVSDQPSTADDMSADLLFIRRIKYSVQPSSTTFSQWLAGNGIWDGEWMIGKSFFAGVRVTGTLYELVILGTG